MNIFINGRFLSQSLSGVQRFALEIVKAIDALIETDQMPAALRKASWTLLIPPNCTTDIQLRNIRLSEVGRRTGHAWDQIDLAWASRSGILLSLCNSGPIFHRKHHVVIHDAQVFRHPEFFSRKYAFFHRGLGRLLALTSRIMTVSEFSRSELSEILSLSSDDIVVCPNSADHLAGIDADEFVLERFSLARGRFFLMLGSLKKNKNIEVAVAAANSIPEEYPLVIVGSKNEKIFSGGGLDTSRGALQQNVIFTGELSDRAIVALYRHATAFVFPSLYEGFGVPVLEAMLFGCPLIVSDIQVLHEICGDAADYVDPRSPQELASLMDARTEKGGLTDRERSKQQARLSRYSWHSSALIVLGSLASN